MSNLRLLREGATSGEFPHLRSYIYQACKNQDSFDHDIRDRNLQFRASPLDFIILSTGVFFLFSRFTV